MKYLLTICLAIFCQVTFAQDAKLSAVPPSVNLVMTLDGRPGGDGKSGGEISRKDLLLADKLVVMRSNGKELIEDSTLSVVNFKMSLFARGNNPVLDKLGVGDHLTTEMKDMIKAYPVGTKIYFEYINAGIKGSGIPPATRKMPPMAFTIASE